MSFAIFILPNQEFYNDIMSWKKLVEINLKNQPYNSHPPHLTVLNIDIKNIEEALKRSLNTVNSFKSFELEIKKTDVFWDDFKTDGGHTLYYKVKRNKSLYKLQRLLAESLISLNFKKNILKNVKNKEMSISNKKYGSPFIGNHWIPHFSISSLKTKKDYFIIKEFLKSKNNYRCHVNEVSFWEINNENHHFIKQASLK